MSHAELSPSKANRWLACAGSVREEKAYPDVSGPSAIEGTHTHTVLEHCIKADLADARSMIGVRMKDDDGEFIIDADRAARVEVAVDYIRKRRDELMFCQIIPEQRVNPAWFLGREDMKGTADIQIHGPDVLEIADYKDGVGEVSVVDNPQLELYALGALAALKLPVNAKYPYDRVRLTVIQPKLAYKGLPAITHHEMSVKELLDKIPKYVTGAAATDVPDAPLVAGDHCKFCKHKGSCAALASNVMKEVGMFFQPVAPQPVEVSQQAADKDPTTMNDEQLRQIMEAAPLMRQLLEAVEKEALRRLEAGVAIPGLKLVNGRGSRAWALKDDEMAEKLVKMGIPKTAVYVTKLVSPAQAEKLTWEKRDGTRVQLTERQLKRMEQEYVVKMAGKLTVVPESDNRQAVNLNVSHLFGAIEQEPALPDWLK